MLNAKAISLDVRSNWCTAEELEQNYAKKKKKSWRSDLDTGWTKGTKQVHVVNTCIHPSNTVHSHINYTFIHWHQVMQQRRKYSKLLLSLTFCEIRISDFLILFGEFACDCDSCMFEMCIVPLDEELGAINKWTLELCGLWAVFLFQDEYNTHSKYQATCSCCCFLFLSCQGQINVIELKYNISIWNVVEQKYKAASVFNAQSPSASKFYFKTVLQ